MLRLNAVEKTFTQRHPHSRIRAKNGFRVEVVPYVVQKDRIRHSEQIDKQDVHPWTDNLLQVNFTVSVRTSRHLKGITLLSSVKHVAF